MITEDFYVGRTIIDDYKNTLLIQPTKKTESKYKLYLHNLTDNTFVSTLFITHMDEERTIFRFNRYDLPAKLKRFYVIIYDNLKEIYEIRQEKEEKLTDNFVYMEEEKRRQKEYIRRYKEI